MESKYIIKIDKLSKSYKQKDALKDISLNIFRGSVTGLFGENGAGKTTLMKLLTNQIKADKGSIVINGSPLIFNSKVNAQIGCLLEKPPLYPYLTAEQHLSLFKTLKYDGQDLSTKELIEVYDLTKFKDVKAKEYSLGMSQRLGLAIAELSCDDILILDEPFNGLDPVSVNRLRERILTLKNKGVTIILSSHLIRELENVIDNLIIISQGRLLDSISIDDFMNGKDTSLEHEILKIMEGQNGELI